jgi:hypothetical protein
MRAYAFAIAAAALFAFPASAFSQAVEVGPGGVEVEGPSEGRSVAQPDDCGKLQQACLAEDWLGLGQGKGKCQHATHAARIGFAIAKA